MAQGHRGPQVPIDPIELLTNTGVVEEPYTNRHWGPGLCAGFGFLGVCVSNWYIKRPFFVGIQRHISFAAIGALIGQYIDEKRVEYLADRDAVLRHYIQLHPEDFPIRERKKYADVLGEWMPIR